MTVSENEKIINDLYQLYNKNDLKNINKLNDFLTPDFQLHDPAAHDVPRGPQALIEAESSYVKAFPNKVIKMDEVIAVDNKVIVRWTAKGTQKGEFEKIAPSNKEFKISGISIYEIKNRKICCIWQIWDQLGLLEQLGEFKRNYAIH